MKRIILVLALLLSACATQPQPVAPVPTPSATPTVTAQPTPAQIPVAIVLNSNSTLTDKCSAVLVPAKGAVGIECPVGSSITFKKDGPDVKLPNAKPQPKAAMLTK